MIPISQLLHIRRLSAYNNVKKQQIYCNSMICINFNVRLFFEYFLFLCSIFAKVSQNESIYLKTKLS